MLLVVKECRTTFIGLLTDIIYLNRVPTEPVLYLEMEIFRKKPHSATVFLELVLTRA